MIFDMYYFVRIYNFYNLDLDKIQVFDMIAQFI